MRKETKTTELANTDRKCQDCKLLPFLVEFFFGVEVIFAIRLQFKPIKPRMLVTSVMR